MSLKKKALLRPEKAYVSGMGPGAPRPFQASGGFSNVHMALFHPSRRQAL